MQNIGRSGRACPLFGFDGSVGRILLWWREYHLARSQSFASGVPDVQHKHHLLSDDEQHSIGPVSFGISHFVIDKATFLIT